MSEKSETDERYKIENPQSLKRIDNKTSKKGRSFLYWY